MRSTDRGGWLLGLLMAALAAAPGSAAAQTIQMEPVKPAPVAADAEAGRRLYERYCTQCHGDSGKGDGPAAELVYPRPRDFTTAIFKVRSTPSGGLPTDHDLFRVISEGLPGTSMPAWKRYIPERDRWQLVHYVKTFDALGLFKEEPPKEQVVIGPPPKADAALIARGRELYESKKCAQCHGPSGRGDGPSASGMKDEWGHPIRPVNFTKGWRFRGGDHVEDIYRTFTTGFNGTPMPSFVAAIPDARDRWALAAYVRSLSRPLRTGQVLRARRLAGDIPADPSAKAWADADFVDFPLAGQIILDPRWFTPAHDVITARALYNDRELAILLEWDDGTHGTGRDGKPPDQAAIQFPAARRPGEEKPYFVLGDAGHPVDYWRWNAAQGLARFLVAGARSVSPRDAGGLAAHGVYRDGQYRVIFRRARIGGEEEPGFEPGRFTPIAFHLWDGDQGEEGLKVAISAWYYLLLDLPTPPSVYLWPLGFGLLALGGEIWLLRRFRGKAPSGRRS